MKRFFTNQKVVVSMLTMLLLIFGRNLESAYAAEEPTITVSAEQPLTESTLDGSVVTLTLSGGTFNRPIHGIVGGQAVTGILGVKVSGITGLRIPIIRVPTNVFFNNVQLWGTRSAIDRISPTQLEVKLAFDGNLDTDSTITFTVEAEAIADYNGPAITAEIPIAVPPTDTTEKPIHTADVNADGTVNIQDLVLIASNFGQAGETPAHVNADGVVNIQDLVLAAGAIGNDAAAPALHTDSVGLLTSADVKQWLSEAQQFGIRNLTSQRGIRFLEQLLAALMPRETALLANYPNPFNPETWIPYQLSKPANVTLHIYAANGRVVRTLSLGHQPAGMYQNRSRAAYWDGRNAYGEPVASGLYFYTLTAGEFSATRKMLIRK